MKRIIRGLAGMSMLIGAVVTAGAFTMPDLVPQLGTPVVELAVGGISEDQPPPSDPTSVAACDHYCVESNVIG